MIESLDTLVPRVASSAWVHPSAVVVGDVTLGEDASVWPTAVVRGDVDRIVVGDRTNIQDGSVLHVTHRGRYSPDGGPLVIGSDITIGHKVILHACTIGNGCLIGMGAVVMDNVIVGEHCLIAAGSLVSPGKQLPPRTLWRGAPARLVRELTDADVEQLDYSAHHYVKLKNRYVANENQDQ